MIIVFSGFRDEKLKEQIEEKDGKVYNALVKDATHVLVKKGAKPSKKLEEAKEKGLEILDLQEFLDEYEFSLAKKDKKKSDDEEEKPKKKATKKKETDDEEEEKPKKKKTNKELFEIIITAMNELKSRLDD
jgi:HSP90 family molecular chaperone